MKTQNILSQTTASESRTGTQWRPYLEWSVTNDSYSRNPFDLLAKVSFRHEESGETHTTEMFYAGDSVWQFRFTGTRPGKWTFTSASSEERLNDLSGSVLIERNPDPKTHGFLKAIGNKWAWQGTEDVFIPQYVMSKPVNELERMSEAEMDAYISEFVDGHGFNGFHLGEMCFYWFDLDWRASMKGSQEILAKHGHDPNPDPRAFAALERFIVKVHAVGYACSIWNWQLYNPKGRFWTSILDPDLGGLRGPASRRVMRYIAARLGPIPGWCMGFCCDVEYQFPLVDLDGDTALGWWHDYYHRHLGWEHLIGARTQGNGINPEWAIAWNGDYVGWEDFRVGYDRYVHNLAAYPGKVAFSTDQFRIRKGRFDFKDYDEAMTRRGLWHSAMAGGVGNIWGYLRCFGDADTPDKVFAGCHAGSGTYPAEAKAWIKTYAQFFQHRFRADMARANELTDYQAQLQERTAINPKPKIQKTEGDNHFHANMMGETSLADYRSGFEDITVVGLSCCLCSAGNAHYLFYQEDCESVRMDLSGMKGAQPAVAVDTKAAYAEIDLGLWKPSEQTWQAPYKSDWAIAVGKFG